MLGTFQLESQLCPAMRKIDEGSRYLRMGGSLSNLQAISCVGTTLLGVPGHFFSPPVRGALPVKLESISNAFIRREKNWCGIAHKFGRRYTEASQTKVA